MRLVNGPHGPVGGVAIMARDGRARRRDPNPRAAHRPHAERASSPTRHGCGRWSARPVQGFFDRAADGWDARTGAGSPDHLAALAVATQEIKPVPERVLDLGTGTGEAALFLAREFPRASVRGVDLSERMIQIAQGQGRARSRGAACVQGRRRLLPPLRRRLLRPHNSGKPAPLLRRDRPRPAARRSRGGRRQHRLGDPVLHPRIGPRPRLSPPRHRAALPSGAVADGTYFVGRATRG